ncbi:MAG: DNA polymerase III subunit gamma/tau [Candidatus Promineifilaceae bacterium]|nr:DNA polymerase III subunit gamma/tau [Candidatus Promineifilaceae bacterium]
MSQALYRKWRPARFDQIVGQEHVTRTLQNAVAAERIGHAYLFSGPRGTGKTTTARLLAKAANCLDDVPAERPCNRCRPCLAINEGRFLDLIEIDAASNTGVDDIRDLRDKINFAPSEGRIKVYIIDEVHMLSTAAFNALLKTLEEPPAHAMFVLATTEEHKVPLTIKSRCQPFNFRLLTLDEITARLAWLVEQERLTVEGEALTMIAQHGNGSLRDAESLLDQLVAAPGDTITLERARLVLGTASNEAVGRLVDAWLAGDGGAGLDVIHQSLATGADARQFARQLVTYLRQVLLVQTAGDRLPLNLAADQVSMIKQQARRADRQALVAAVKAFNEAAKAQAGSWQPQLPLELAFIELLPHHGAGSAVTLETPQSEPPAEREDSEVPQQAPPRQQSEVEDGGGELNPEPTALKESPPALNAEPLAAPAVKLQAVKDVWSRLRDSVAERDRNLPALLASCKPLGAEGHTVILGFDYPILKDKFERWPQARDMVGDALSRLLGQKCLVRTVITAQYIPPADEATVQRRDFAALADELGGVMRESDSA